MTEKKVFKVAVIVAHPDDEVLWTGGTLLNHPEWHCFIVCLCRKHDADRAPKFAKVLKILGCSGIMGDLDDGPDQLPQPPDAVSALILDLLPPMEYDLIITHSPTGEYTRHRRHEEIGEAIIRLWNANQIATKALHLFAYEDHQHTDYPRALSAADHCTILLPEIWKMKYTLMKEVYGYSEDSWEVRTTPSVEAFWQFKNNTSAMLWLENVQHS